MADSTQPEFQNILSRGEEIYDAKVPKTADNDGKFVAIEVESQDYYIADTRDEAVEKARASHPTKAGLRQENWRDRENLVARVPV